MKEFTVGSLFSGIGGMDYGLEQSGMKTIWQVEYDDWCREVALPQNFLHTEKFNDVRTVGKHNLSPVNLICGGFPCQDISNANQNGAEGLDGKRSGLWSEYCRIICELQPEYALIENVSKLLIFGLDRVICDLAAIGYDAEWKIIRAAEFGLPHERKRLFILANSRSKRPIQTQIFPRVVAQVPKKRWTNLISLAVGSLTSFYPEIPKHLRVDNGVSFELSEIERAIKGYGNAVAPPVAKWLGEQVLRYEKHLIDNQTTKA